MTVVILAEMVMMVLTHEFDSGEIELLSSYVSSS